MENQHAGDMTGHGSEAYTGHHAVPKAKQVSIRC